MIGLPKVALKHSVKVEVKEGEVYKWCACGLSTTQPFCDGSHKGTDFSPVIYVAKESRIIGFCGCKQSKNGVLCDGAHKILAE